MSTSSVIGNMQSALDCAGKCDCCDKLQSQINALKQQIGNLSKLTEADVRRIAKQVIDETLNPKVQEIEYKLLGVESTANSAQTTANTAEDAVGEMYARYDRLNGRVNTIYGVSQEALKQSGTATNEAAKATAKAVSTANEVTGLKGIIDGFKSRLGQLGDAIAKAESLAGDAIVKAAKAIGISEQALGATARLAGKVIEIFNVIATIFTIIEQLETLRILGDRIDAVENGLLKLGSDVSGILGKLLGIQNRIARNEATIGQVKDIAVDAQLIGEGAQRLAGQAQISAGRAQAVADGAFQKASQAQLTADGAARNAATANENAKTAYTTAVKADNFAGQAFEKGLQAIGIATTALTLVQLLKLRPGIPGRDGLNGRNGLDGLRGTQGIQGIQGIPGITTVVTLPGVPGRDGAPGTPGSRGPQGIPGRNGTPGIPGRNGINGTNGINGRNGIDVNPAEAASLRALIIQQHTQTRANSTVQHSTTRTTILTPIMTALAPILALLKQIYDIVSKAAGAAQLALLQIINNKLGSQVVGGIGGLITRVAENTYLEKALSVLTFAATMHNALMLSNNLGQTLISIIDQVTGFLLPKGIDGTPINFGETLGKTVHLIIASAIGEENYTELTENWQKANRIYQATSNVFNQVTQLGGLITSGLELVAGNVGKIGNALRKGGVLLENAYNYMNPQPNLQGKFFSFMNTSNEKLSSIAAVVAIPIAFKEVLGGINSSTADLKREISQTDPKDANGNPIKDAEGNVIHYKPGMEVPTPIVEAAKGEQAKADSTNFLELVLDDIFDGGD